MLPDWKRVFYYTHDLSQSCKDVTSDACRIPTIAEQRASLLSYLDPAALGSKVRVMGLGDLTGIDFCDEAGNFNAAAVISLRDESRWWSDDRCRVILAGVSQCGEKLPELDLLTSICTTLAYWKLAIDPDDPKAAAEVLSSVSARKLLTGISKFCPNPCDLRLC